MFHEILPPLKAGMVVLADRYTYTAFARDVVRGVSREWVQEALQFCHSPGSGVLFQCSYRVAMTGCWVAPGHNSKFYEAGMDMGFSQDVNESFRLVSIPHTLTEYDKIVENLI